MVSEMFDEAAASGLEFSATRHPKDDGGISEDVLKSANTSISDPSKYELKKEYKKARKKLHDVGPVQYVASDMNIVK
jgi:hypothetical protein